MRRALVLTLGLLLVRQGPVAAFGPPRRMLGKRQTLTARPATEKPRADLAGDAPAGDAPAAAALTRDEVLRADAPAYLVCLLGLAAPLVLPGDAQVAPPVFLALAMSTLYVGIRQQPFSPKEFVGGREAVSAPAAAALGLVGAYLTLRFSIKAASLVTVLIAFLAFLEIGASADLIFRSFLGEPWSSRCVELSGVAAKWLRDPSSDEGGPVDLRLTAVAGLSIGAVASSTYLATTLLGALDVSAGESAALNNLLAWAICCNGLSRISLASVRTGAVLLLGLAIYDVSFTLGSDMMETVATQLEAPTRFLFPAAAKAASGFPFRVLGLGDVLLPGLFLGFLASFDRAAPAAGGADGGRVPPVPGVLGPPVAPLPRRYFQNGLGAYGAGLVATFVANQVTESGQPALLYIVPALFLVTFATASSRDEVAVLLAYNAKDESDGEGGGLA